MELKTVSDLKISLEFTQAELKETQEEIKLLNKSVKEKDKQNTLLENRLLQSEKMNNLLQEKILQLDIYSRRENLKFSGITEDKDESGIITEKKIRDLFIEKLKLKNVAKKGNGQKNRDIVVRFV